MLATKLTWDQCHPHNRDESRKTLRAQWDNRIVELASQTAFLLRVGCLKSKLDSGRMVQPTSKQGRYTWSQEEEEETCVILQNHQDACSLQGNSNAKLEAADRRLENMGNSDPWSPTLTLTQAGE